MSAIVALPPPSNLGLQASAFNARVLAGKSPVGTTVRSPRARCGPWWASHVGAHPPQTERGKTMSSLDILKEKGVPLDRQVFTWRELAGPPFSKLNDDAFTRVRVILMNGIEAEAVRFSHAAARMNKALRGPLARVRRIDHHQQTLVNWLNPPDQSVLETTIGYEQAAIEVTASVAQAEPDPYMAQVYRFGMLEDFD